MSDAVYNENAAYPAQWLRNLIDNGHIAPGVVLERDIRDVQPDDLAGYRQAHFFAGIGAWSHALRLAGWPDELGVWTGSCPCQPWSSAGRGAGPDDPRHLWPAWFPLIRECRPSIIFGEQVGSPDGRAWLDAVCADLETLGYAVGASDLCAAGIGAPHIRQRLFFVAHAAGQRLQRFDVLLRSEEAGRVAQTLPEAARGGASNKLGHADERGGSGPVGGFWGDAEWIPCTDGSWRAVEPGTFPLVARAPGHMGQIRAYGNAIVAQLAAEFIGAAVDTGMLW